MAEFKHKIQERKIPLDVSKDQIVESEVFDALIEMDSFDILEMGRGEGEGCYCSINNYLKRIIDILSKNYDFVLIDAPAGLEYFARKTGRNVTDLVIVTDPSKMGFHTMKYRAKAIGAELTISSAKEGGTIISVTGEGLE